MNKSNVDEWVEILEQQGRDLAEFRAAQISRIDLLEEEIVKRNRPPCGVSTPRSKSTATMLDVKTGRSIPSLTHKDSLVATEGGSQDLPSMGRILRGIVSGGRAPDADDLATERKDLSIGVDSSGGYTVQGALASSWIDSLRANMALSQAGVTMIPMDTKALSLARIVQDPQAFWHAENAALTASDPTLGQANLSAKTVACVVKLSLELAQDSANIEQILTSTITSALAQEIDAAGLTGKVNNAALAPSGIMNAAGRNKVTAIGAPTSWDFLLDGLYELMLDNVPQEKIGAFIAHPALWKKLTKLKTGIASDQTSLSVPGAIATIPKIWTTSAPFTGGNTCAGIVGNWSDLIFGIRKEITVRVLSETLMGSNLQIAVLAYARVDFVPAREASFCTLEGITV